MVGEMICSKCNSRSQVWKNQITNKLTCHRYGCNNREVDKMEQHIVKFEVLAGAEAIKDRTFVTASDLETPRRYKRDGGDRLIHTLLVGRHSTTSASRFRVTAWVEDRTHDHIVRHDKINDEYACSTSRLELLHGRVHKDNETGKEFRLIQFDVTANKSVRVSEQRECPNASDCTMQFWQMVMDRIIKEIPELLFHATRPCVRTGFCTEVNKDCGYVETPLYREQRGALVELAESLRKRNGKECFANWKERYLGN